MDIGIAYDLESDFRAGPDDPDDRLEEYESPDTIKAIDAALRASGLRARRLGGGEQLVRGLLDEPPDLVFNISEGWGTRSREAHVPAILELLGLAYTHSDPFTMAVSLEKGAAKTLVGAAGVPTPGHQEVEEPVFDLLLELPVVAKPVREGSSMGIRTTSILRERSSLEQRVAELLEGYRQPVLLEEFCPGPELTVGILGTGAAAEAVGVMEILPRNHALDEFLYSIEVKRDYDELDFKVPPERPASLVERARDVGLAAYRALGCRDVGRIDLRVGRNGEPQFLEANPLPGLHPVKSDLVILSGKAGIGYDELIGRIVASARARHGL